jgi:hypothetical protein
MKDAFLISFLNTLILLVWFQTNAFAEYFKNFFIIKKIIRSYNSSLKADLKTSFVNFLSLNYDCFFVRLITCPFCLNFWISILTSFFVGYEFFPLIYVSSMIYYKVVNILTKYERI